MRTNSIAVALSLCAAMLIVTAAPAQKKRTTRHHTKHHVAAKKAGTVASGAETSLGGIKLYDSGTRVIAVYGSPDVIEAVALGGTSAGPGGGAAGGPRGAGLPGGPAGGKGLGAPGVGGGAGGAGADVQLPGVPGDFGFGDSFLDRQGRQGGASGLMGPSAGPPGGGPGTGGVPGPNGMAPQAPPGMGGPAGGGGNSDRVLYTRWIYNRNASKFGFILDKWNHVVQCEAIGIQAGKASTRRGITFGSTFAQIINKYKDPDGYEINGDNIVVRYLSKDKCAFRLNRLGENKPYVVTAIVVAAGKR